MTKTKRTIGFIGGSGVYELDAIENKSIEALETPWGSPSSDIVRGTLNGVDVAFLTRHGPGHKIPPGEINYRANIHALKSVGVTDVISLSACGSFRENLSPGTFVIVDQFIDRTTTRDKSFFGKGFVAHVSMADPVCPALSTAIADSCEVLSIPNNLGGTYIAIDGPQFSSRAESNLYRSSGCDVIGMTNMPEAKLAREAELPYATAAMVTDYDCWRESDTGVDVSSVLAVMKQNAENAVRLIDDLTMRLGTARTISPLGIETCLDYAVITGPEARDANLTKKLSVIAGRFLTR